MYAITARRADPTTRPSLQLYAMFMANKPPDDIRVAASRSNRSPAGIFITRAPSRRCERSEDPSHNRKGTPATIPETLGMATDQG
jgi:hypothetical protein